MSNQDTPLHRFDAQQRMDDIGADTEPVPTPDGDATKVLSSMATAWEMFLGAYPDTPDYKRYGKFMDWALEHINLKSLGALCEMAWEYQHAAPPTPPAPCAACGSRPAEVVRQYGMYVGLLCADCADALDVWYARENAP